VAGEVQHLEDPVAEIELVTVIDCSRRSARHHGVGAAVEIRRRHCGEQLTVRGQHVPGLLDLQRCRVGLAVEAQPATDASPILDDLRLAPVDEPFIELVQAADVVEVVVGGDRDHPPACEQVNGVGEEADDAETGVNEQIRVAPPHVPAVAAKKGIDVRLGDVGDSSADIAALEPTARRSNGKAALGVRHHSIIPNSQRPQLGASPNDAPMGCQGAVSSSVTGRGTTGTGYSSVSRAGSYEAIAGRP
jgi:hypothetical protein